MMKTIILDTDFVLSCIKWRIDISQKLEELCNFNFKISYLDKTLDEIKNKPNEKLAKEIISNFDIIETKKDKIVDELILDISKKDRNVIIATQDKKLKEKLKKGKIAIITIRQKKYLIFI